MADDDTTITLADWLTKLSAALAGDAPPVPTDTEQKALLDIARIAAHRSERIAAPISTYLIGAALASAPASERAGRLDHLRRILGTSA